VRIVLVLLGFALNGVWAPDGLAQGTASLWDHNGSDVSLFADGPRRQFRYEVPVPDLLPLGVQPGTLLFDGRRNGNQYAGTAYVFSSVCGALPYAVEGPVAPDQRSVTMYGKAPSSLDEYCRVIGYRDDVLVFTFAPPVGATAKPK
jgi:hypothetical protein